MALRAIRISPLLINQLLHSNSDYDVGNVPEDLRAIDAYKMLEHEGGDFVLVVESETFPPMSEQQVYTPTPDALITPFFTRKTQPCASPQTQTSAE